MRCRELEDLVLLAAAGVAEPEEARAVREHLSAGCPLCTGRRAEAEALLAQLPLALEPIAPSPSVRTRLLERVGAAARTEARELAGRPKGIGKDVLPFPSRAAEARPASAWLRPAIAALVAAGIVGLAVYIPMAQDRAALHAVLADQQGRVRALETEVERATSTVRMLRSPAVQVVALAGAEPQPGAAGRIFWDRKRREWKFFAADLRPPEPGREYELWFITEDQRKVPAGTFTVDASGEGELSVSVPEGIGTIVLAAVTDEPAGGSPQPTGQIHLVGKIPPATSS